MGRLHQGHPEPRRTLLARHQGFQGQEENNSSMTAPLPHRLSLGIHAREGVFMKKKEEDAERKAGAADGMGLVAGGRGGAGGHAFCLLLAGSAAHLRADCCGGAGCISSPSLGCVVGALCGRTAWQCGAVGPGADRRACGRCGAFSCCCLPSALLFFEALISLAERGHGPAVRLPVRRSGRRTAGRR